MGTLVTFLASFLIWFMFAGLVYLWVVDGKIKKEQAFHALITTLIAWGIANMIKNLFPTERPFEVLGLVPLTATLPQDGSFPSEHTTAAWALAATVWQHDKKSGLVFAIMALGVGLGRILSHVHYSHDVFGGAFIGISTAFLFEKLHLFKILSGRK
jgi:undecaprenyl-diphosphatase